MRTTINLDDHLLRGAKELAARTDRTLTAVLEDTLREVLGRRQGFPGRKWIKLPVSECKSGTQPGVDLDNSAALLDILVGPTGTEGKDAPS